MGKEEDNLEFWLRGKVEEVPDLLQPAAHAFLQSKKELRKYLKGFPESQLWEKPAGRASVGFHLQHIAGVTDRLLTYAQGEQLSEEQCAYLKAEGVPNEKIKLEELIEQAENIIDEAINYLKNLSEENLTHKVEVGRKRIESTLIGVLFHAAEHSQRHIGQMLVTTSVVRKDQN